MGGSSAPSAPLRGAGDEPRSTPSALKPTDDDCPQAAPSQLLQALKEPTFAPREAIAGKDARTFARDVLAMDVDAYRAAFRGSAMKRAKLPAMKRNAAVVLGNVGTAEDVDVLTRAMDDDEPLVREHAAWALTRLRATGDTSR